MSGPRFIEPLVAPPDAVVHLPGSKSITNRALLLAGLAEGVSTIRGALVAEDTAAMVDAVRALGAEATLSDGGQTVTVRGIGGVLPTAPVVIEARQAATVGRFLAAVAAAGSVPTRIEADRQLQARPIAALLDALVALGATVDASSGFLPATIRGPAQGGRVDLPGDVSSQFLSALLLAGSLYERGVQVALTSPLVSAPYVAMTSSVMRSFGGQAAVYDRSCAVGPGRYRAADYVVEPDASAGSYFFAAAAVTGGTVRVDGLTRVSLQGDLRFVEILAAMGATVDVTLESTTVTGGALRGVEVDLADCSDTLPTLGVVAALAEGPTTVRGVGFVRGKETDRIAVTARELRRCGAVVEETSDGLVITPGAMRGATIDPAGDHRIAMAFAVLGLVVPGVAIDDPGCVAKTFPHFFDVLSGLRPA